jgi:hypothetical protein
MRAYEFTNILLEYNRNITLQNKRIRDGIIREYLKTKYPSGNIPSEMSDPQKINEILNFIMSEIEKIKVPGASNNYYTPWFAKNYADGNFDSKNGPFMSDSIRFLEAFHNYKNKDWFPSESKDILKFTPDSLRSFIENLKVPEANVEDKGKSKVIINNENLRLIQLLDKNAAIYYGRGTNPRWCTSYTNSENKFDEYNNLGDLYVLLPNNPKYNGEKYQLYFLRGKVDFNSYLRDEITNDKNKQIVMSIFYNQIKDSEFREFLLEKRPELKESILIESRDNVKKLWDGISEWYKVRFDSLAEDEPYNSEGLMKFWTDYTENGNQYINVIMEYIKDYVVSHDEDFKSTFLYVVWKSAAIDYLNNWVNDYPKLSIIRSSVLSVLERRPDIFNLNNLSDHDKYLLKRDIFYPEIKVGEYSIGKLYTR